MRKKMMNKKINKYFNLFFLEYLNILFITIFL